MHPLILLPLLAIYTSPSYSAQIGASGLPDGPPSHIQDCALGGDYAGLWTDGNGTYINSDSVRYNIGKKCWNDYLVVETSKFNDTWYKLSGDIFCTGTTSCTTEITQSHESCFTQSTQISASIGFEAIFKEVAGISLGAEVTKDWSEEHCYTDEKKDQCQWGDGGCHSMWARNEMVRQRGYKRERCNTGGDDFTNCMSDWETTFSSGVVDYDCGMGCSDINRRGTRQGRSRSGVRTVPRKLVV